MRSLGRLIRTSLRRVRVALKRVGYEAFRDRIQKPERVVHALEVAAGERIADVGAGWGYFTFRLARAVAATGKVYAIDLDPDMLGYLRERARRSGLGNVVVIEAASDDPRLPEPVDLIFNCITYHHIDDRVRYFRTAARYLRAGGRVAIVEGTGKGFLRNLFGHATPPEIIRRELDSAGYELVTEHRFLLPGQSFQVFVPRASGAER